AATRAGNLFTTHTAVAAGFDRFAPELVATHLGEYARTQLGISVESLLGMGRQNPRDASESFNMAYLAIRGSGAVNAVSRLHGFVSRELFESVFPRHPVDEVPVGHVTNGVHVPTWDGAESDALWTQYCGSNRWQNGAGDGGMRNATDAVLWEFRASARRALIEYARERLSREL